MPVQLNHTIVHASDKKRSAEFLAEILGLPRPVPFGPFLVNEDEFDEILDRIQARGLTYWADPLHREPGRINRNDGGRGLYWSDPDGHNLEIITRPYGSGEG